MKTSARDQSGTTDESQVIAHEPLISRQIVRTWALDQVPLVQCILVAVSVHVVLLPVMWIMGWALPWPKPPVITTIIEYDLSHWPEKAKPRKVFEIIDPDLN
ncbi:MAG: hypothetical protein IPM23_24930 [Candidatus Melainabacteria bacterium]|nr:hypothetical protein [Candidatus Melainabacteria bacterium]